MRRERCNCGAPGSWKGGVAENQGTEGMEAQGGAHQCGSGKGIAQRVLGRASVVEKLCFASGNPFLSRFLLDPERVPEEARLRAADAGTESLFFPSWTKQGATPLATAFLSEARAQLNFVASHRGFVGCGACGCLWKTLRFNYQPLKKLIGHGLQALNEWPALTLRLKLVGAEAFMLGPLAEPEYAVAVNAIAEAVEGDRQCAGAAARERVVERVLATLRGTRRYAFGLDCALMGIEAACWGAGALARELWFQIFKQIRAKCPPGCAKDLDAEVVSALVRSFGRGALAVAGGGRAGLSGLPAKHGELALVSALCTLDLDIVRFVEELIGPDSDSWNSIRGGSASLVGVLAAVFAVVRFADSPNQKEEVLGFLRTPTGKLARAALPKLWQAQHAQHAQHTRLTGQLVQVLRSGADGKRIARRLVALRDTIATVLPASSAHVRFAIPSVLEELLGLPGALRLASVRELLGELRRLGAARGSLTIKAIKALVERGCGPALMICFPAGEQGWTLADAALGTEGWSRSGAQAWRIVRESLCIVSKALIHSGPEAVALAKLILDPRNFKGLGRTCAIHVSELALGSVVKHAALATAVTDAQLDEILSLRDKPVATLFHSRVLSNFILKATSHASEELEKFERSFCSVGRRVFCRFVAWLDDFSNWKLGSAIVRMEEGESEAQAIGRELALSIAEWDDVATEKGNDIIHAAPATATAFFDGILRFAALGSEWKGVADPRAVVARAFDLLTGEGEEEGEGVGREVEAGKERGDWEAEVEVGRERGAVAGR